jgi:hypothetical protein
LASDDRPAVLLAIGQRRTEAAHRAGLASPDSLARAAVVAPEAAQAAPEALAREALVVRVAAVAAWSYEERVDERDDAGSADAR